MGLRSAVETIMNMDAIVVFRKMNCNRVQFYIIFSRTHKMSFRCNGDIDLPLGVWMKLQYTGDDFEQGCLNSHYLRLIKNITAPRYTNVQLVKRSDQPGYSTDYAVILILRAYIKFSRTGEPSLISEDIGYIMVDEDRISISLRSSFEKAVVVEVEFVNGLWWLRELYGEWREDIDLEEKFRNKVKPSNNNKYKYGTFVTASYTGEDSLEEDMKKLSLPSNQMRRAVSSTLKEELYPPDTSEPMMMPFYDRHMEMPNVTTKDQPPNHLNAVECDSQCDEVPKWISPKLIPSCETFVDITTEKPAGTKAIPAWCCIVKIRDDHIICYAPIPGIHKILVTNELLKNTFHISEGVSFLKLGHWINVMCEPRREREYDDFRPPHFSHIATQICTIPQPYPPVKPWEQRFVYNLLQVFLRCDLNVPGNIRRIQVGNEKYLLLNCTHNIPVLVPARRLDGALDAKLTAEKQIGMWATRKKRAHGCDMFLIDSEDIVEVNEQTNTAGC